MSGYFRIAALAACSFVLPTSAPAEKHVLVRSGDLDLKVPHDVVRLDRRIARAAGEVCGPISTSDLVGMNRRRRCTRASIAAARPQRDRAVVKSATR
jgi:UrcA family protein